MHKDTSKKLILFVAILVVAMQSIFILAQNAGFSLAQSTECSLTVSLSPSTQAAQYVSPGQTGVSLIKFNLLSNCAINLNSFAVSLLPMPNAYSNISSLRLYNSTTQLSSSMSVIGASVNFTGLNMVIPASQAIALEVKADIGTSAMTGSTIYGVFGEFLATAGSTGSVVNSTSGNNIVGNIMTVNGSAGDTILPTMPIGLVATKANYNEVDLSWSASTDNVGVVGYEVWRTNGTWVKLGSSSSSTYIDTTIASGTGYYYKVIAYDAAGNKSSPSAQLFLNTPATPAGGDNTSSCTGLTLVINDADTAYAASYNDPVNFTWTCASGGIASNVYVKLYRSSDGVLALTLPNGSANIGTETRYLSTSSLSIGSYILKACFDSACAIVSASQTFTIISNTTALTSTPTPTSPTSSGSGSSASTPILNAWIDTVPNTATTESSATIISGIKSAGATSPNTSFSNLTFYLYKIASAGSVTDWTNYYTSVPAQVSGSQITSWKGTIGAAKLSNGNYKFFAKGYANRIINGTAIETEYTSNPVYFAINNSTTLAPTHAASVVIPIIKVGINSSTPAYTIGGKQTIWADSSAPLTGLSFKFYNAATNILSPYIIIGYPSTTTAPDAFGNYNYWLGDLDTVKLGDGKYKLVAKGMYNSSAYENTVDFYFNINNSTVSTTSTPMASPISLKTSSPFPTPVAYKSPMPYGVNPAVTNLPGSPVPYVNPASQFPEECREKNIFDPEQCKQLMSQLGMPQECLAGGAKTQEDCTKIIISQSLPPECREANAISEDDCNKVMFIKYGPKECIEANIFDKDECEKFIFKKNAPSECISQGLLTPANCEKYMIGKYGNLNNIKPDNLPLDCQKAGATSAAECDKIMKDKYMPTDCKDQGITDAGQCDLYLSTKNMPVECRGAGVKTKEECDKVMFKKFSPEPCKKAGIEDEKECKDFMFNLYAPRVSCDGLNSWDCKREVQENHLGNIVAKQEDYKKMKEEISSLSGTSASIEKIKEKIGQDNKMIPLTENATVLKIASADEKMVLNEKENLVQTAPIAVMIDSDGDGIPDDTEKRIGTDPNNRDTDNDGFSDSEEVKYGYNPLGTGEMTEEAKDNVSPIDWALIQDKTLGHPTVDGLESKELVVSKFASINKNSADSSANGYELTGKGEKNSVMTIYIYSDMPVVATVKTDEFGNWKYELNESLVDGEHEVYVAVNDNTGKVINKSQPLSFFINEAKAISVSDFINSQNTIAPKESEKAITSYTIAALLAIIAGLVIFIITIIKRKKQTAV